MSAEGSVHIRHKALSRAPRQSRDTYGAFDGNPQQQTLCGSEPTTNDISWAGAGYLKFRAEVTCAACTSLRGDP